MSNPEGKKYWMTVNTAMWAVLLAVSFFVIFPGFIALMVIWAIGKINVTDKS